MKSVGKPGKGMSLSALDNQSMTMMTIWFGDLGRSVMKSMAGGTMVSGV